MPTIKKFHTGPEVFDLSGEWFLGISWSRFLNFREIGVVLTPVMHDNHILK